MCTHRSKKYKSEHKHACVPPSLDPHPNVQFLHNRQFQPPSFKDAWYIADGHITNECFQAYTHITKENHGSTQLVSTAHKANTKP